MLAILGLADDARNRASVQRYLKLAAPPLRLPLPARARGETGSRAADSSRSRNCTVSSQVGRAETP